MRPLFFIFCVLITNSLFAQRGDMKKLYVEIPKHLIDAYLNRIVQIDDSLPKMYDTLHIYECSMYEYIDRHHKKFNRFKSSGNEYLNKNYKSNSKLLMFRNENEPFDINYCRFTVGFNPFEVSDFCQVSDCLPIVQQYPYFFRASKYGDVVKVVKIEKDLGVQIKESVSKRIQLIEQILVSENSMPKAKPVTDFLFWETFFSQVHYNQMPFEKRIFFLDSICQKSESLMDILIDSKRIISTGYSPKWLLELNHYQYPILDSICRFQVTKEFDAFPSYVNSINSPNYLYYYVLFKNGNLLAVQWMIRNNVISCFLPSECETIIDKTNQSLLKDFASKLDTQIFMRSPSMLMFSTRHLLTKYTSIDGSGIAPATLSFWNKGTISIRDFWFFDPYIELDYPGRPQQ